MKIEYKHVPLGAAQIKATGKANEMAVELHASTFTTDPDAYNDVIRKGAFSKTLAAEGRSRVGLRDHVPGNLIGMVTNLREDSYGLRGRFVFVAGVQLSEETWKLAAAGVLTGVSIGYTVPSNGSHYEKGVRILTAIDLWEVSLTTFPANTHARTILGDDEKSLRSITEHLRTLTTRAAIDAAFQANLRTLKG